MGENSYLELKMNKKRSVIADIKRIEYLDEKWFCPNCGKVASVRFEYGIRILKCEKCGEFTVGMVFR